MRDLFNLVVEPKGAQAKVRELEREGLYWTGEGLPFFSQMVFLSAPGKYDMLNNFIIMWNNSSNYHLLNNRSAKICFLLWYCTAPQNWSGLAAFHFCRYLTHFHFILIGWFTFHWIFGQWSFDGFLVFLHNFIPPCNFAFIFNGLVQFKVLFGFESI